MSTCHVDRSKLVQIAGTFFLESDKFNNRAHVSITRGSPRAPRNAQHGIFVSNFLLSRHVDYRLACLFRVFDIPLVKGYIQVATLMNPSNESN